MYTVGIDFNREYSNLHAIYLEAFKSTFVGYFSASSAPPASFLFLLCVTTGLIPYQFHRSENLPVVRKFPSKK